MSENKKGDVFKVLSDEYEYFDVNICDIGLFLEEDNYGVTLYNGKWRGHNGVDDKYKGTEYENHCVIFAKCIVEKVVDGFFSVGYIDINQKMDFIIDFDSCKDIVCVINGKTITLDKEKLQDFLLKFSKESEE